MMLSLKDKVKNVRLQLGTSINTLLYQWGLKSPLFKSASAQPFSYLNKLGQKKAIDRIYSKAFGEIFLLLRSLHTKGDIFEFGVFYGYSALWLTKCMRQFNLWDSSLHLFDSFVGLPEAKELDKHGYEHVFGIWQKGSMAVKEGVEGAMFKKLSHLISPDRIHIVKGYYEESLESYFGKLNGKKARLIHLDCDLYSSSKFVFEFLIKNEIIQDGTLLIFDDWMTSLGNPNLGQRKGVQEVLEKYPFWSIEKYLSYGIGSHVFVAHDHRIKEVRL